MAFGAVGGIAHGITMLESFKAASWRRPRGGKRKGGTPIRVYLPDLDTLWKPSEAKGFLEVSSRVRGSYGCLDTHCCPKGVADMLQHPSRHFVWQRSKQIRELSTAPESVRVQIYLDNQVRRVSDNVAAAASIESLNDSLKKGLSKKQKNMGRFRQTIAHLAEANPIDEPALAPLDRATRQFNQRKR